MQRQLCLVHWAVWLGGVLLVCALVASCRVRMVKTVRKVRDSGEEPKCEMSGFQRVSTRESGFRA